MLNSHTLYSMEDENVFSMSVPKNMFIPSGNIDDICDTDKNIPSVLLSPSLASKCKKNIQINNSNNNNNITINNNIETTIKDGGWMLALDDSIILPTSKIGKIRMKNKTLEDRNIGRGRGSNSSSSSSCSSNTLNSATSFFLNTEESCYNYYNMAQQNYQLWLSSF
ncbi:uncharacterized protein PWA37_003323 [Arxiozyma heterogenica]|uniref:uncharacterized protein n=1 Tax=Arxiozyma heterogenica TaxID=278026 RepID=UPI002F13EB87